MSRNDAFRALQRDRYTDPVSSEDRTTAAQRIRIALDLFELAEKMLRQRLRRSRPGASEAEIEAEVIAWRMTRPGAELGDAPGRLRPWPKP